MTQHPLGVRPSIIVREPTPQERDQRIVTVVVMPQLGQIAEEIMRRRIAVRLLRSGLIVPTTGRHLARECILAWEDAMYRWRRALDAGGTATIKKSSRG